MRHRRKSRSQRFDGRKAQIATDTDSQLITAVEVLPGNAPDADGALEVVEASVPVTGCQVVEAMGDCAYGAGDTRPTNHVRRPPIGLPPMSTNAQHLRKPGRHAGR